MIDLLDPELHARGAIPTLCAVRAEHGPIVWTPGRRGPGYWSVLGHPELLEIAHDPETFSSASGTRPEVIRPAGAIRPLHNVDPPAHRPLRATASQAFHARHLAALDPLIEPAFARVLAGPTGDLVPAIEQLVAELFVAWLGLRCPPGELLARVTDVHHAGAALLDTARTETAWATRAAGAQRATEAMARWIRDERAAAREDSVLHALRDAPDHVVGLLVLAGLPTSIDAVTSAIADLSLVDAAPDPVLLVEELLRRASPIAQFARRATRDVERAGVRIRAGEQVVLWFVAANHDDRVFASPATLDPGRSPNPHVAFGAGPHRCLGGVLGRRLVAAVVAALRDKVVVVHDAPLRASSYLRGRHRLVVAITPAAATRV